MHKSVLFVNLKNKTYEVKKFDELAKYIGGVAVGFKLLLDNIEHDPIIFSIGPLNGVFPFASKTSIVLHNNGVVEDLYIGGSLSSRMAFSGVDSIVFIESAEEPTYVEITNEEVFFKPITTDIDSLGLPGKRSVLKPIKNKYFLDDYFLTPELFFEEKLAKKNVGGIVLTGTKTREIKNPEKYKELLHEILGKKSLMEIDEGDSPSCTFCPMGCSKSRTGEIGGNILVHSMVGCKLSQKIYSDVGTIFSCLSVLGYSYTHEDIEDLPLLVKEVLEKLN